MTEYGPPTLPLLPSGIPGLDVVLRGGVPEFSFNLITGSPGAGKTTLAHQIMFANATPERPALYFTVLGESPIKMLRYQQQLGFFDLAKVDTCVHFLNLSALLLEHGLTAVLEQILQQVRERAPAMVVVDSFQAVARTVLGAQSPGGDLQDFVQRLAIHLSVAQATTFLIGEQLEQEPHHSAVLTVADGIIALSQSLDQNAIVRKLQVVKSRGLDAMPGLHTFRITRAGIQVFPRISLLVPEAERVPSTRRIPSGVAGLDALMGGGLPSGDAVLVRGPSGAGKSVLATQFIAAGVANGEPGVIMVFEEHPKEYMARAASLGMDLAQMQRDGMLRVVYLRPLDLSPDEALYEIRMAVEACGAKRVVIDSLSGFELALAATFRLDFRESIYRLVTALTGLGITVLITMEITEQSASSWLSPYAISFLADTLLLLQFGDHAGILTRSLLVQKMRNSAHSHERRQYAITARGLVVSTTLAVSDGTARIDAASGADGLTVQEAEVLQALIALGESAEPVLAQRTGIGDPAIIRAVLARLIALGYVVRLAEADPVTYRAVAQAQRRPL
jgi:circadian clock protein KaiC